MADGTHIASRYFRRSAKILGISQDEYLRRVRAGEKWCCGCKAWHLTEAFGRDRHTFDGLTAECLASKRIRDKKRPSRKRDRGPRIYSQETRKKMAIAHAGERNHKWKGGITPSIRRARQNADYQQWRRAVLKRDQYRCVQCGADEQLHAHHLVGFTSNPSLRLSVSNGQTLCRDCHITVHARNRNGR